MPAKAAARMYQRNQVETLGQGNREVRDVMQQRSARRRAA